METIIGIDLGTTNSEVAIIRDGQPVVLEEDGDPILPSVVGLDTEGRLLVGKPARNQYRAGAGTDHPVDQAQDGPGHHGHARRPEIQRRRRSRRSSCGRSSSAPRRRWGIRSPRP